MSIPLFRSSSSRPPTRRATSLTGSTVWLALGGFFSLLILAFAEGSSAGAELVYLAVASLPGLLALSLWTKSRETQAAWGILGLVALLWFLPGGATRFAVMTLFLVAATLVAASWKPRIDPLRAWLAMGLGLTCLRVLWRPQLLTPIPRDFGSLLAVFAPVVLLLPAVAFLQSRRGTLPTALALATIGLLGGGITRTVAIVGLLLAVGESIASLRRSTEPTKTSDRGDQVLFGLGVLCLVIIARWETRLALVGSVAALVALLPRRWAWIVPSAALVATALLIPTPDGLIPMQMAWVLLILLPTLVLPSSLRIETLLTGLGLAALGLQLFPGIAGFALGAGWIALRLKREATTYPLQATWLGLLFVLATLLAALPWDRPRPLVSALELLGGAIDPRTAVLVIVAAAALGLLLHQRPVLRTRSAGLVSFTALTALVIVNHAEPRSSLRVGPFQLDPEQPILSLELDEPTLQEVVVETTAVHSAYLPRGTALAFLELRDEQGEILERLPIRAGIETADWTGAGLALEPWQTVLSPDGHQLSRRYRARLVLDPALTQVSVLRWVRSPRLSEAVQLVVRRIEVSP